MSLILSLAVGVAIGIAVLRWMYRPARSITFYQAEIERHQAFERFLDANLAVTEQRVGEFRQACAEVAGAMRATDTEGGTPA